MARPFISVERGVMVRIGVELELSFDCEVGLADLERARELEGVRGGCAAGA